MKYLGPRHVLSCLLFLGGCTGSEHALVSSNGFDGNPVQTAHSASYAPAPEEQAKSVDAVGRKILAANKKYGLEPIFVTAGAPQPEIFHQGTTQIVITSGLVAQCQTQGQLAAVLCSELGKMLAEREAQTGPAMRRPDPLPPMDLRIGSAGGGLGPADQTQLAEMAKFEPARHGEDAPLPRLPDAEQLARSYLRNAGYSEAELAQVTPLLNGAAANSKIESQLTHTADQRTWINANP